MFCFFAGHTSFFRDLPEVQFPCAQVWKKLIKNRLKSHQMPAFVINQFVQPFLFLQIYHVVALFASCLFQVGGISVE